MFTTVWKGVQPPASSIPERCALLERTMPRHSLLLRRCYHRLAEEQRGPPCSLHLLLFVRSSLDSSTPLSTLEFAFHFSVIFQTAPEGFRSLKTNIMLITKYHPPRDYRSSGDAMCRPLFMKICSLPDGDRWKISDAKLIAVRYLTKYARAYNWILFMDFIQNVYRRINYKRRARKERRERRSAISLRLPGPAQPLLSFHPELWMCPITS